jgi:Tol biopolymer transport system component
MNADGSELSRLTDGDPNVDDCQPALSPDGTRIAFSSNRNANYDIYVMDADGRNVRRLTSAMSDEEDPAWSPDGSRIAFVRGNDLTLGGVAYITSCSSEIYVMDADGGKEINLTQGQGGTDPAWSPDGKQIAFSSYRNNGNYEIFVMGDDGNDVKQLTFTESAEGDPAWSPDGQFIAYGGNYPLFGGMSCGFMHTGREPSWGVGSDVYVMKADGTDQVRLTTRGDSSDPVWSPTGTRIAFIRYQGSFAQIYCMNADGSNQTRVTDDASNKSYPSWSQWGTP